MSVIAHNNVRVDGYVPRARDAAISALCDGLLYLTSARCRAITAAALHEGLLEVAGVRPRRDRHEPPAGASATRADGRDLTLMRDYHDGVRDRAIAKLCDGLLRLASGPYRTIIRKALAAGVNRMVAEQSPFPPFREPLDD